MWCYVWLFCVIPMICSVEPWLKLGMQRPFTIVRRRIYPWLCPVQPCWRYCRREPCDIDCYYYRDDMIVLLYHWHTSEEALYSMEEVLATLLFLLENEWLWLLEGDIVSVLTIVTGRKAIGGIVEVAEEEGEWRCEGNWPCILSIRYYYDDNLLKSIIPLVYTSDREWSSIEEWDLHMKEVSVTDLWKANMPIFYDIPFYDDPGGIILEVCEEMIWWPCEEENCAQIIIMTSESWYMMIWWNANIWYYDDDHDASDDVCGSKYEAKDMICQLIEVWSQWRRFYDSRRKWYWYQWLMVYVIEDRQPWWYWWYRDIWIVYEMKKI